jgi:hypothetical protein
MSSGGGGGGGSGSGPVQADDQLFSDLLNGVGLGAGGDDFAGRGWHSSPRYFAVTNHVQLMTVSTVRVTNLTPGSDDQAPI